MQTVTATHIESRPDKCDGRPCIRGTRIRVQDIYVWHEIGGRSPIDIIGEFPELSLADVHAAIVYYLDHLTEIETDLADEQATYDRLKAQSISLGQQKLRVANDSCEVSS